MENVYTFYPDSALGAIWTLPIQTYGFSWVKLFFYFNLTIPLKLSEQVGGLQSHL